MAVEPFRMEADVVGDTFRLDMLAGVLAFPEEAVEEDGFNPLGVKLR